MTHLTAVAANREILRSCKKNLSHDDAARKLPVVMTGCSSLLTVRVIDHDSRFPAIETNSQGGGDDEEGTEVDRFIDKVGGVDCTDVAQRTDVRRLSHFQRCV